MPLLFCLKLILMPNQAILFKNTSFLRLIKMAGWRAWNPPPPTNTSKIHLHVERFSLKTNWKLAERLLYNQGCKKDPLNQVGREQKPSGQDLFPWEGTQREMTWGGGERRSVLGSEWFEPHIGTPSPGVQHREDEPPWLVGGSVGLTGLWKPGPHQ